MFQARACFFYQGLGGVLVHPDELGPPPAKADLYERNNLWQLCTALSHGPEKLRFITLWDGKAGDGRGGTEHMIATVEKHSGRTYVIPTADLW